MKLFLSSATLTPWAAQKVQWALEPINDWLASFAKIAGSQADKVRVEVTREDLGWASGRYIPRLDTIQISAKVVCTKPRQALVPLLAHEAGHALEWRNEDAVDAAFALLDDRVEDDKTEPWKAVQLFRLRPGKRDFWTPYARLAIGSGLEVLSTAVEGLFMPGQPVLQDPEHMKCLDPILGK